jgi:K+-transporting ATPase KdpF subunit
MSWLTLLAGIAATGLFIYLIVALLKPEDLSLACTRCSACRPGCRSTRRHGRVTPDSAFNTAISFVTNTNWQGYGGETTMSYLTQMLGWRCRTSFSAATGIVVVIALIRGFAAPLERCDRQLLGRSDPRHAVGPAADVAGAGLAAGEPGRDPELRRLPGR